MFVIVRVFVVQTSVTSDPPATTDYTEKAEKKSRKSHRKSDK